MAAQFVLGYNRGMQRSAALFARVASPFLLCLACSSPKAPAPNALDPEVARMVAAHTAPVNTVQAAPPEAQHVAAASCGAGNQGNHEGCCGGSGEGSCGSARGSSCGGSDHGSSCAANTGDALPGASEDSTAALTRIEDPSQVCMVRNHFMGRPQLSIEAEGSTYYGCCAGCANRLLQDARARTAIDPISHNPVDKGLAVLARNSRGAVLYFENESNLEMFRATMH
jgi:YHS domain-containing protein